MLKEVIKENFQNTQPCENTCLPDVLPLHLVQCVEERIGTIALKVFDAYSHLLQMFAKSNITVLVYITLNGFVLRHKEESVYHSSRKKRNREDDLQCDPAPLCKRINDLHSSNFEATNQQQLQHNNHIYEAVQGINNSYHSQQQYLPKDIIVTQPLTPQHMELLPHHPISIYNPD
uniref:Uncharacterized protein n=1 Tax=Glossina pallidipes TaxID=7398 RepID=A0A1B0A286_GLOPL